MVVSRSWEERTHEVQECFDSVVDQCSGSEAAGWLEDRSMRKDMVNWYIVVGHLLAATRADFGTVEGMKLDVDDQACDH